MRKFFRQETTYSLGPETSLIKFLDDELDNGIASDYFTLLVKSRAIIPSFAALQRVLIFALEKVI